MVKVRDWMAQKWKLWIFLTAILVFIAVAYMTCFWGQPQKVMTNVFKFPCVSCGSGWNGSCTQQIKDACCESIPIIPEPTCGYVQGGTCGGTCPDLYGWKGTCVQGYDTTQLECQCQYKPPS